MKKIFLFFLIIGLIILVGCNLTSNINSNTQPAPVTIDPGCPYMTGLYERLDAKFEENLTHSFENYTLLSSPLNMELTGFNFTNPNPPIKELNSAVICKKGSEVGENQNYYYCGPFFGSKNIYDNDGTILEKQKVMIEIVLNESKRYKSYICKFIPNS